MAECHDRTDRSFIFVVKIRGMPRSIEFETTIFLNEIPNFDNQEPVAKSLAEAIEADDDQGQKAQAAIVELISESGQFSKTIALTANKKEYTLNIKYDPNYEVVKVKEGFI
jgi:hypothetical protein